MEDATTCGICLENKKSIVFLCGHGVCSTCSGTLRICHMCRKPIQKRINLYWWTTTTTTTKTITTTTTTTMMTSTSLLHWERWESALCAANPFITEAHRYVFDSNNHDDEDNNKSARSTCSSMLRICRMCRTKAHLEAHHAVLRINLHCEQISCHIHWKWMTDDESSTNDEWRMTNDECVVPGAQKIRFTKPPI